MAFMYTLKEPWQHFRLAGGLGLWTLEFRSPDGALLESTGHLGGHCGAIPSDCRDDHSESCLTFTLSQFFVVSNLCSKNRGVL